MPAIVSTKYRIYLAQKLIEGLFENTLSTNNIYLWISKTLPWDNNDKTGATDNLPPFPEDTVDKHISIWKNMMHLKKISSASLSLAIPRFDWQKNIVYQEYSHDIDLFDPASGLRPFYVVTDELNVYKCLFNNNGGPSFVKPTGTNASVITTADRYLWKYMYTIDPASDSNFSTPQFVPVSIASTGKQFIVQQLATAGAIDVIKVIQQGFGYTVPPVITILGDGNGATANCDIANGKIVRVNITNKGKDYTHATATVASGLLTNIVLTDPGSGYVSPPSIVVSGGGGAGATAHCTILNGHVDKIIIDNQGSGYTSAPTITFSGNAAGVAIINGGVVLKPIIPPQGGHGADAVSELGAFFVMIDGKLLFNEGNFTTNNDFRIVGLMLNPLLWNTSTIATGLTYTQSWTLKFSTVIGPLFAVDSIVTGATSGATGAVLDYDAGNRLLRVVNVEGKFLAGENVVTAGNVTTGVLQFATGTAQSGASSAITLAAGDAAANHFYEGYTIRLSSGTGNGQQRVITSYNSTTKVAIVDVPWDTVPDHTSVYSIASITYPDLQPNTGNILYVENRRPISRSTEQAEDFKLVLEA